MSAQESRKQYQSSFMDHTTYLNNVDDLLDLYNEGRCSTAQLSSSLNLLKAQFDNQFAIPASASPASMPLANHEWNTPSPYDHGNEV